MNRAVVITLALILLTVGAVSATDHWPQFRGMQGGVARRSRAARHLERDRERRVEDRHPRPRLELAGRLGRSRLRHDRDQQRAEDGAGQGPVRSGRRSRQNPAARRASLDGLRHRLQDRARFAGQRELHSAPAADGEASEEQLRVGDAGHRRRARLRVLRQHRPGRRARLQRQAALDEGRSAPFKTRSDWGTALAGPPQGPRSTSSTTTTSSRSSPRSTRRPARRSGASSARKWRTGRRRSSGRTSGAPRSSPPAIGKVRSYDLDGKLLWELTGMSTHRRSRRRSPRHGLLYVSSGYPGDPLRPVYAIRPGASGDISLKPGETSNEYIAWSQPLLGTYNTSPLVYGDYYYTLLDRGFLLCHDAQTGKQIYRRQRISADASGFTASPWAYNGKIFALSEDGDTFVMQAGPGVQGARQELARARWRWRRRRSRAAACSSGRSRSSIASRRSARREGHSNDRRVARFCLCTGWLAIAALSASPAVR